ncbi:conserved protein of unknown function [Rhodovastum atsumiense]|uniref:Uncharacterized protein n=1 Tax=Rhodovastum atsumiense TaxID=504468 RepID=A0A5M6IYR3_9PROT|nr:hypothetical protein [Rhodovastum atsumiense]KAA5613490.1 hypothetical protein F1189_05390 [Rhodovastum atsumiense]CAH2603234.1 conserved protein of unknown function [Rhodovastum atsumiense]
MADIESTAGLSPAELVRLRHLAQLEPEVLEALANLGVGMVTAGRVRRGVVLAFASVGAVAAALVALQQLWVQWRGGR